MSRPVRGRGWNPDLPALVRDELARSPLTDLIGAGAAMLPRTLDYAPLLDKIPDQGPTSSCVGQACASAIYLTARVEGHPIPRPSAKLFYDFARREDSPYVSLVDFGSRPLAAIRCGREKGMIAESEWPLVFYPDGTSNVDVAPPLDVFQTALGFRIGSYYRVYGGPGAAVSIRHALARGYFPIFAMPVDEPYEYWDSGEIYPGRIDRALGGHMQATCGYDESSIHVVSSWGTDHGANGIVRIADAFFDSGEVSDIIVATVVPKGSLR